MRERTAYRVKKIVTLKFMFIDVMKTSSRGERASERANEIVVESVI